MNNQGGFMILVISAFVIGAIVMMLGLWYHREKKRAGARLRELRDAISEMKKE